MISLTEEGCVCDMKAFSIQHAFSIAQKMARDKEEKGEPAKRSTHNSQTHKQTVKLNNAQRHLCCSPLHLLLCWYPKVSPLLAHGTLLALISLHIIS